MTKKTELPELPHTPYVMLIGQDYEDSYTADQMHAHYAKGREDERKKQYDYKKLFDEAQENNSKLAGALTTLKAQPLQAISDLGQLQSALEENERLRKELAAVKGEGEAVAWRCKTIGYKKWNYTDDEPSGEWLESIEPLYLHSRAESSDGEMLEWVIKNGLPRSYYKETKWSAGSFGDLFDTPRDAIRAAMKARS